MKICFVGAMSTKKSTTAEFLNVVFKASGVNSVICPEYARDYILRCGIPVFPWEQHLILDGQIEREEMLASRGFDVIICDSSALLNFVYASMLCRSFERYAEEESFSLGMAPAALRKKLDFLRVKIFAKAMRHMRTYDRVYCFVAGEEYVDDGVRFGSPQMQQEVALRVRGLLVANDIPFVEVNGPTVAARAEVILKDLGYCELSASIFSEKGGRAA